MQVINNNINTLSQGILLGSNLNLDLPYAYGNNVNNTFNNNQITNCQISPLTLESALTVNMATNTFTDIMCNVFGELRPPLCTTNIPNACTMSCVAPTAFTGMCNHN